MRMELTYASSSLPNLTASASASAMPHRSVKIIPLEHPSTTSPSSSSSPSQLSSLFSKWTTKMKTMTYIEWIETFVPCYRWIRIYKWRDYLQADLMAGVTVGVMLVPQSMSYAKLAGLQPIYGLYSGFVPIFVYAIFGSSRQLAIGPVALVSLLVSNVLGRLVDPSDDLYTELAILLALMVGIMECIMGLLRLGWLIRFISHSVISGFTTSSAIVIALSQAKYFLGYDVDGSSKIIPVVTSIIKGLDKFLWQPFVMGSFILAILLIMKHLGKTRKNMRFLRAAGPLTAVVVGTAFVKIFHPSSISLVGSIPQGLPKFSIPKDLEHAKSLIPTAMLITGVAILESVGIAKALAAKNGYELDSNQELFGLGVANILGSMFSAYPTTGSFSRSAVNHESGAKTGLSGILMGIIMCCALLFMTPIFEYIPQCALAAIVISAVVGLLQNTKMVTNGKESSYEELRRKRVEENKKRMEELNLNKLAQSLHTISASPIKKKPRTPRQALDVFPVRRSSRVADLPPPTYREVPVEPLGRPKSYGAKRSLLNRIYASDKDRQYALERAIDFQSGLALETPSFVKPMLQSHVTGGFWLGLPLQFCKPHLPNYDEIMTLVDEDGNEWHTKYLDRKTGLSGGWKGFAVDHDLVDGDALVFQLIKPTKFQVKIIRVNSHENDSNDVPEPPDVSHLDNNVKRSRRRK